LKNAIRRSTSAIVSAPIPSPGSSKSECVVMAAILRQISGKSVAGVLAFQGPAGKRPRAKRHFGAEPLPVIGVGYREVAEAR
jgi:hypothetical protein